VKSGRNSPLTRGAANSVERVVSPKGI